MPFANTDSIAAADLNNMIRGLYRDNTDHAVTGGTGETTLGTYNLTAGTMTATGAIHIQAAGSITSANDTKRIRLYFGATAIVDTTALTGTGDWWIDAWVYNTATNAQRCVVQWSTHNSATNYNKDYLTAAIDTTANVTVKVTGTLANALDTVTQTTFSIHVVQVT